jgi:tRNA-5-methyluridine54 2-sulfurtransferase
MTCQLCDQKVVIKEPSYCKTHFIEYFENNVLKTIKKFKLFNKKDNLIVAVSGGKDSLTILHILKKYNYNVSALAIDEGITGYRDKSLITVKQFCKKNTIDLKIVSFESSFKQSLDNILKNYNERPCTICGIFRRYLLNLYSKEYDAIVTGHNMDDEAQAIIMNLVKNNVTSLNRQGPISGLSDKKGFTKRVKPLYLCSEKEVMIYSFFNKLTTEFNECPNVSQSFRLRIRDQLNNLENSNKGSKKNIINWFINYKKKLVLPNENIETKKCSICGENTTKHICNTCVYIKKISVIN